MSVIHITASRADWTNHGFCNECVDTPVTRAISIQSLFDPSIPFLHAAWLCRSSCSVGARSASVAIPIMMLSY